MKEALKLGLATAAFGAVHSLLASRRIKGLAAERAGRREADGLYRIFYIAQSLATFGLLAVYGLRLPGRVLYRVRGPAAVFMRLGQAAGILHAVYAAAEVGLGRITGLANLSRWLGGEPVPAGPVAQGPELEPGQGLTVGGPFRWSRHPLNLSPVAVFWLTPVMTTRRLGFNLVGTAYLILGSLHEESRLRSAYGETYAAYQMSGVPFYWPRF